MSRSDIPHEKIIEKIKEFSSCAPVTIQTMICASGGEGPSPAEGEAWEKLVLEMAASGKIRKIQIYGKARPSPEDPLAAALPTDFLEERARSLRRALALAGKSSKKDTDTELNVEVYQ